MRTFLAIILLSLCNPSFASVSESRAKQIYQKLLRATGVRPLALVVKAGVCSLACTNGRQIFISRELLRIVRNEDELAGVIGHEMAHAKYSSELKADVLGLKYAKQAGYSYCRAAQILKGLEKDTNHPGGSTRYKNTGCK